MDPLQRGRRGPCQIPYSLEQVLEVMEVGWSLLLHPDQYGMLSHLMAPTATVADLLAFPDYRVAHVPPAVLERASAVSDHGAGLPVVMLETIAAHLRLATSYLRDNADEIFLECSSTEGATRRDRIFTKAGEAYRWGILMQGVANAMVHGMRTAGLTTDDIPWHSEWMNARRELGVALDTFTEKVVSLQRCDNPIGADDTSLPLYFIDPQGTNQKFFASSDYLMQGFASPAVSEARSTFEAMRSAVTQARDSEIRAVQTEEAKERNLEQIAVNYGRTLADACGLDTTPEVALERFLAGEYRLDDCHRVRGEDDIVCADLFQRVWDQTAFLTAAPLGEEDECYSAPESRGSTLNQQRLLLCALGKAWVDKKSPLAAPIKFIGSNEFERNKKPWSAESGFFDWDSDWVIALSSLFGDHQGGPELLDSRFGLTPFSVGAWPLFDDLAVDRCGENIVLPSPHAGVAINGLLDEVKEMFYYWSDPQYACVPEPCSHSWMGLTPTDVAGKDGAAWCEQMFTGRKFPGDDSATEELLSLFPEPTELATCYKGDLAGHELAILSARQSVRQAKEGLRSLGVQYDIQAQSCMQLAENTDQRKDAHRAHYGAMEEIRRARSAVGFFGSILKSLNPAEAFANGVLSVAGAQIERAEAAANQKLNDTLLALDGEAQAITCWSQANSIRAQMQSTIESVKQAYLGVTAAYQQRAQRLRSLTNLIDEARIMQQREMGRGNTELRHHFWLDERTATFERTLEWARRVVYLAMQALEYEVQASLGIDAMILGAKHPQELEDALRELQRTQASRGINGNRPEEKTVVFSLRDELLQLSDRFYPNRDSAEKQMSRRQDMIDQLKSPNSAVFDNKGNYLGRALRFHIKPKGPLEYRCAERVWGVSATVEGDLFGVLEPRLPVFLLKQNTFQSQWCEGQSPDGERYQRGAMRPSMDLFRPGTQKGQAGETEAWSWAFVDAWLNVPRRNFASEVYSEGDSDELAGRGLYGEYMLLFPAWGFLDTDVDLDQIEDVLLRFEYVSVSNGPPFGPAPSDPQEPLIRETITGFSVDTKMCEIEIRWTPPNLPRFDGVQVLRRNDGPVVGPDDQFAEPLDCDEFGGFCRLTNLEFEMRDAHYAAFAFDDWGDVTSEVRTVGPITSTALTIASLEGDGDSGHSVELSWTAAPLDECVSTAVWRTGTGPFEPSSATLVFHGVDSSFVDETLPGTTAGDLRKWYYAAARCLGGQSNCKGPRTDASPVITDYTNGFDTFSGWTPTDIGSTGIGGQSGVGLTGSATVGCMTRAFDGGTTDVQLSDVAFDAYFKYNGGTPGGQVCVDVSSGSSPATACGMTDWHNVGCVSLVVGWAGHQLTIPTAYDDLPRSVRIRMTRVSSINAVAIDNLVVGGK